jgi:predicted NBD/HSP70 family sugar kinase
MISAKKTKHDHVISANSKVVRNINRAVILNFIRERQPISRAAIARLTRLNKSTVSSIVAGLLKEDLIVERVDRNSAVGRNPISLHLNKGHNIYGAISVDSGTTRIAVVDLDGTILHTDKIKTDGRPADEFLSLCVDRLIGLGKHLPHLTGIGVSIAGVVDASQGRVLYAPNLGWEDVSVSDLLAKRCPEVPIITVENDAKASAIGELWFGDHKVNLSNFVFLTVGRGIGTGIVIDKRILTGESHLAGEFGHMVLLEGGEPCVCGNRGCWEAYASDQATVRRYAGARKIEPSTLTIDDVISAAKNGDGQAVQELKTSGHYIGIGIANVVKAVDPSAIVVGGHITRVWDMVVSEMTDAERKHSFFGEREQTPILPTSMNARPSLLGAAALAQRVFFGDVRVSI